MLSNDVTAGAASCLRCCSPPKGRLIAPLRVWRRGPEDFLLLTEPELGEVVRATLLRSRFAAKCEIELEEHASSVVFGEGERSARRAAGQRRGPRRRGRDPVDAEELERARIEAGVPALGQGARRLDPACGGGPRRDAHLVHEGLLPGPGAGRAAAPPRPCEPAAARARSRVGAGPVTRSRSRARPVGRVTSAVSGLALGYVRVEVPDDAGSRSAATPRGYTDRPQRP